MVMGHVLTRDMTDEVLNILGKKMKGLRVIIFGQAVLF